MLIYATKGVLCVPEVKCDDIEKRMTMKDTM